MTTLRPTGKRILIEGEPVAERSKGGVYLPDTAGGDDERIAQARGVVVALGPRVSDEITLGMEIVASNFGATDIQDPVTDKRYFIVHEDYVLSIVERTAVPA